MKKIFLLVVLIIITGKADAQTKGTNTIGLNLNFQNQEVTQNGQNTSFTGEQKTKSFGIGYGYFIRDNERIGLNVSYGKVDSKNSNNNSAESEFYGGNLSYQKYFPLLKNFYAFGGGSGGYSHAFGENASGNQVRDFRTNFYSVAAYGGLAWFVTKRIALETDLLSAGLGLSKTKEVGEEPSSGRFESSTTSFDLSTSGQFDGLGFKIYFLF